MVNFDMMCVLCMLMKSIIYSSVMAAEYGIKSMVLIRICRDLWSIQYLCAQKEWNLLTTYYIVPQHNLI